MDYRKIIQGETVLLSLYPKPLSGSITDWDCQLLLADEQGNELLSKTVTVYTDDNLGFSGWLTPTETENLAAGSYVICSHLKNENTTPIYSIKHKLKLVVEGCI